MKIQILLFIYILKQFIIVYAADIQPQNRSNLILLLEFARHGARTPLFEIPFFSDYKPTTKVLGELTPKGI